jgi:basic membrane protein A and related proteins
MTDRYRSRSASAWRVLGVLAVTALLVLVAGACGGSGSSGGGGGGKKLTIGWLYYGPFNDGGWNVSSRNSVPGLKAKFGDQIANIETDNVPYTQQATQITEGYIVRGAKLLVDTIGLADLFTKVCAKHPEVKCLTAVPVGKLPPNTTGMYGADWYTEYAAGVAGGLMTKTNTLGFIQAYDIPFIQGAANAFTLGCLSVNPKCKVKTVVLNNYFDPPATARASNSLIDAGADVVRGVLDDPSYCKTAQARGVYSIPMYWDASAQCPKSVITSTVWNFGDFYEKTIDDVLHGRFDKNDRYLLTPGKGLSLGKFGPFVPADVQKKVRAVFDAMGSGSTYPFVGPMYDNKGVLRVKKGEKLTEDYMWSQWKWSIRGIE